jgi:RES domain-containing protein
MILWRISNYADLAGVGGLRAGGRWHFAGQPIVYLAEHPALALLEILVHLEVGSLDQLPRSYQLLRLEVDESITVAEIGIATLPDDWKADCNWTQNAGTEWLCGGSTPLLKVPSAVVPFASNYLLNPAHPDVVKIQIVEVRQVQHDPRILSLLTESPTSN